MDNEFSLLIIDDEPHVSDAIRIFAGEMGFKVWEAGSYEGLSELYDRADPTIIILDPSMPKYDGMEFLRELAKRKCQAQIFLSSGQARRVTLTARRLGLDLGLNMANSLPKTATNNVLESCLATIANKDFDMTAKFLSEAIKHEKLVVYYQPKVALTGDNPYSVTGAEALVRLNHPVLGLLSPDLFIGLAEENDLIGQLTNLVLKETTKQIKKWGEQGIVLPISVNISPLMLTDLFLPDKIAAIIETAEVDPSMIVLEVTEKATMADAGKAMDILKRIRLKNISVSLDDFGAGYSSIVELYRMPLNELKLDGALIRDMEHNEDAFIVIRGILAMARELGIPVCAEGVETLKTAEMLRRLECQTGQGYYFSKPLPVCDFSRFVIGR